ncbi:SDR family NAD(P)-dependent oxidoreductase [Temperatibacter marinus]|uniref:SDR family NAD(P)-dependent oxidoreductase n=1 Tax=Temperatibacter marinus TaxID=1456591 RepID=A0AA52EJ48_9PROT|nr:SDR family NAD(P)-dependent oxidoreductase [Temperatibacter marinus]WND02981.1 SDR family NAD(P)-dependent oxidoreductase [Temperatibacter marinus]
MKKIILLTGATDGIGFETAKSLAAGGHTLLIHGRNQSKLESTLTQLSKVEGVGKLETYKADLSIVADIHKLIAAIQANHQKLDVIINNAGIFSTPKPKIECGLDVRFMVNTIAPYMLTKELISMMPNSGRVINLSSAAQWVVDIDALKGLTDLSDNQAYGQSKLALTMWSARMAEETGKGGPAIISVNPGSLLGSKMVKEAYGMQGKELSIGSEILVEAAISDKFSEATGRYFDNDLGDFSSPHGDAMDTNKNNALVHAIDTLISKFDV